MKILIPTDFSPLADYALILAQRLLERQTGTIHFLHVLPLPPGAATNHEGDLVSEGELDLSIQWAMQAMAKDKLYALEERTGFRGEIVWGKLTDEILHKAAQQASDLIVMGTSGAEGWQEWLSGSETQQVVRRSEIPVLSLMCDRTGWSLNNILFIHDFEQSPDHSMKLLAPLATAWNAHIHFLYILADHHEHDMDKIHAQMIMYAKQYQTDRVTFHVYRDQGGVYSGIEHFPALPEMDLVCIGTHGYQGIRRLLKGSVAEKLVNHLQKPVLTYHL